MTALIERATDILFGCRVHNLTWPISDRRNGVEPYQVCLTCGAEIPYRGELVEVKQ